MKIAITGSRGYIGQKLIKRLQEKNIECLLVERQFLYKNSEVLTKILIDADVVISLAGAPVLQRWTKKNKEIIYNSRVQTTQNLVQAINHLPEDKKPKLFISASAIGIYSVNKAHDESSTDYSEEFIGKVVKDWEKASENISDKTRRVIFRIGLVLGKDAQTIKKMLPAFKLGLGGTIGGGLQPFPFIHIDDLIEAFVWTIENEKIKGIYNLVAPEQINNQQFTKAFAKQLNRPSFLFIPSFVLKLLFGKASGLLLHSPSVVPDKLIKEGFIFRNPTIKETLSDIL